MTTCEARVGSGVVVLAWFLVRRLPSIGLVKVLQEDRLELTRVSWLVEGRLRISRLECTWRGRDKVWRCPGEGVADKALKPGDDFIYQ